MIMDATKEKTVANLTREIKEYQDSKSRAEDFFARLEDDHDAGLISKKDFELKIKEFTNGLSKDAFLKSYDDYILDLQAVLRKEAGQPLPMEKGVVTSIFSEPKKRHLFSSSNKKFSKDIDREAFQRFVKSKKMNHKTDVVLSNYVLYRPSPYGEFANKLFGNISLRTTGKYPEFFKSLFNDLKASDFGVLSKTYVSMIMLTSIIGFVIGLMLGLVFFQGVVLRILNALLIGILVGVATFVFMYYYPSFLIKKKRSLMKTDLPFVTVHMAAVAGSGAQPISMFTLVLSAGEYKGLEPEIKKILNYVNLFGYDLTTSLRLVAATTPLRTFNELLSGMVTTIETGGDLKSFLEIKAREYMESYEEERRSFTETLATFSDIYIGISLAAPMMLFVVLSIINTPILGGKIAGLTAGAIATLGTFVVIPLMNIIFIVLIDLLQPS